MLLDYFEQLYKTSDFMPHGECLMWTPTLLWTHVGADILTGIAYYFITALLCYFIYKRRDTPFSFLFLLFGAFVLSCGTTHFMAAWTIYYPSYWTEGGIKAINALISCLTVIVLIPLMPKILALPSLKRAHDEISVLNSKLNSQLRELTEENKKRQQAEVSLREQELQYRNLANSGLALIWTAGPDKLCNYFNQPWLNFTGRTLEQELGNGWAEGVHPEDFDRCLKEYVTAFDRRESFDIEYRLRHHSGEYRWLQDIGNPNYGSNGEFIGYIGHCFDISERKLMEQEKEQLQTQLNQSQKMESIGVLAGGIAHDFNNILAAIMGYAEMAREDTPADSQVAKDLDKVLLSAHRAKDLVRQILAFSRQSDVNRTPLKIQPLVKESLKILRASLPTTITFSEDIDARCGSILADPTQIHQIIMNLCTNAFHAMEKNGGTLAVTVRTHVIDAEAALDARQLSPGEYIELTVSDTGTGIGPDILNKIFDPFFTTKEVGKGTGMGLSIIHGIVKSYGGAISVESAIGQGTTFHVYLPVVMAEAREPPEHPQPAPRGKGRILFVDDEEVLMEMGRDLLERLGYTVTARRNSLDALEAFMNTPEHFDLLITDQTMPGMTGIDLARRMLQIRPDLPIILCTGFSSLVNKETARAIGIRKFAMKPLTSSSIGQMVNELISGKPAG